MAKSENKPPKKRKAAGKTPYAGKEKRPPQPSHSRPVLRSQARGAEPTLIVLAEERFPDLSEAERKMIRCVARGELFNCQANDKTKDDPAKADEWGTERVLRAPVIASLCKDSAERECVPDSGVRIIGARIIGMLNLNSAEFGRPLAIEHCAVVSGVDCIDARFRSLFFDGSLVGSFIADRMRVEGSVHFRRGFKAFGKVSLLGARIEGSLNCGGGEFHNKNGDAISADQLKVGGSVFLTVAKDKERAPFKAFGQVRLLGATIGGDLACVGGEFHNEDGYALAADQIEVHGSAFLREGFKASGEVRLPHAIIRGVLDCSGGKFQNVGRDDQGQLKPALRCDQMSVEGGVLLRQTLDEPRKPFQAWGEVRLLGVAIRGNLECDAGEFHADGGRAFSADGIRVIGAVFLRKGCVFHGRISFVAARVEHDLQWHRVMEREKAILDLRSARIGTLWIGKKDRPEKDRCYLHGLTYDSISHDMPTQADWWIGFIERQTAEMPESQQYEAEAKGLDKLDAPKMAAKQQAKREEARLFLPQPYEQAAKILRDQGHAEEAKEILIAKERRRKLTIHPMDAWCEREKSLMGRFLRFLSLSTQCLYYLLLAPLIGYGHRPSLAVWVSLAWILIGAGEFCIGDRAGVMVPLQSSAILGRKPSPGYPSFQPFIYSIELFTPLIKLRQAEFWHVAPNIPAGRGLRWFAWFHTGFGWVMTTLLVAALTGSLKR